jgi:hypothetical protein
VFHRPADKTASSDEPEFVTLEYPSRGHVSRLDVRSDLVETERGEAVFYCDCDGPSRDAAPTVRCIYPIPDVRSSSRVPAELLETYSPYYGNAFEDYEVQHVVPVEVCRYTASVTSSGGRLCPRIRLPSRVVQFRRVGLLVTIPSTGWLGDATQLLERAGGVIGAAMLRDCRRRSGPCLPSPR